MAGEERFALDPAGRAALGRLASDSRVLAIGEGAHFVAEFAGVRIAAVQALLECHGFNAVGLECSAGQARRLTAWLASPDPESCLAKHAGPLTIALYGTFLMWLRDHVQASGAPVRLLGVDLPNTLSPQCELASLRGRLDHLDPPVSAQLSRLVELLSAVDGESAVVSSSAWGAIPAPTRHEAAAIVASLGRRLAALTPHLAATHDPLDLDRARAELATLEWTLEALSGMRALFEGTGIEGGTSCRDYFMARSVVLALTQEPALRVVLLAHNNHVQKEPVKFAGELVDVPMGCHLSSRFGYRSIAVTHLGDSVPEMDYPCPGTLLGFAIREVIAAGFGPGSVEGYLASLPSDEIAGRVVPWPDGAHLLRSQSSMIELNGRRAFDAVICTRTAALDGYAAAQGTR